MILVHTWLQKHAVQLLNQILLNYLQCRPIYSLLRFYSYICMNRLLTKACGNMAQNLHT